MKTRAQPLGLPRPRRRLAELLPQRHYVYGERLAAIILKPHMAKPPRPPLGQLRVGAKARR